MNNQAPPKIPHRFFRWYCHRDYMEDIEGDLLERFERRVEEGGIKTAKWNFTKDVIKLFRPGIMRSLITTQNLNQYDMFKNYYKVAWRHILKEKFYSAINIAGLGVGMACCILIVLYVRYELSFDKYNENLDQTYRVVHSFRSNEEANGNEPIPEEYQVWGCAPIGPALMEEFPEVERVFRFTSSTEWLMQYEDKIFQEQNLVFADSTAFDIFSWDLLSGNPKTALNEPNSIVITKHIAEKYFGSEDPLGKIFKADQTETLKVTGVMEDVPSNTHFTFDGMISMSTFRRYRPGIFESWGYVDFYTYFILNKNADINQMRARTSELEKKYTSDWERTQYDIDFEPMTNAYLHSVAGRQPGETGSITNLYIFSLIGVFILIIACINFINLSTARSLERAKEVGIRKEVGARRNSLVYQFLSEFFLLTLFAGLVAAALVALVFPTFQELTGKPISHLPLFTIEFVAGSIALITLIGIVAGSYPAFLLSKFKPVSVLKGNFRSSSRGIALRKSLVTFQFMLTITLLIGTAVVFSQLKYLQNHDLGFSKEHMLVVDFGYDGQVQNKMNTIKQSLTSIRGVVSVAASRAVPGDFLPNAGTQIEGPEGLMIDHAPGIYEIDTDFIPSYKMEMAAGRPFSNTYASDSMEALIINESAAKLWGYNNAEDVVGKKFDQWGKQGKVIGVVKDFNYQSLHTRVEPLSIRYEPRSMSKLSIRIQSDDISSTIESLEKQWKTMIPHRPFNYAFLDENFNQLYQSDTRFGRVFSAFSVLAIFIACLGLFGLTTYTTTQRTKEIGIRKVLGASISTIVLLLSKDFARLLLLAFLIAIPVSWYAIQSWLDGFAYKVNIGVDVYIIAAMVVASIALVTISWQSIKVALQNPVNSLRNE